MLLFLTISLLLATSAMSAWVLPSQYVDNLYDGNNLMLLFLTISLLLASSAMSAWVLPSQYVDNLYDGNNFQAPQKRHPGLTWTNRARVSKYIDPRQYRDQDAK